MQAVQRGCMKADLWVGPERFARLCSALLYEASSATKVSLLILIHGISEIIKRAMAEVIASVASVASLVDISLRLASSLYKSFQALKDAPESIRLLSRRLETLRDLLQEVQGLEQRYLISASVLEDGLSLQSTQSILQACKDELADLEVIAQKFQQRSGKLNDLRTHVRWGLDEKRIERHCDAVGELSDRLNTALSILGRYSTSQTSGSSTNGAKTS